MNEPKNDFSSALSGVSDPDQFLRNNNVTKIMFTVSKNRLSLILIYIFDGPILPK
jgi:hypothetical protein